MLMCKDAHARMPAHSETVMFPLQFLAQGSCKVCKNRVRCVRFVVSTCSDKQESRAAICGRVTRNFASQTPKRRERKQCFQQIG